MNGLRITSTYFVCKIGSVSCIKKRMFIPLNNLYFDHFPVRSNPLCFTFRKKIFVKYYWHERSFGKIFKGGSIFQIDNQPVATFLHYLLSSDCYFE